MNLPRFILNRVAGLCISRFTGVRPLQTDWQDGWVDTAAGNKLYVHVHEPENAGVYPAVIIVPGGMDPGTVYDSNTEVTARDIASLGFVAIHYDPSGRGQSTGDEDHWGERHQQELAEVIEYVRGLPHVSSEHVGVMSFSIGIVTAVGALVKYTKNRPLFLYDWEGPSNRFNITRNDTHPPLLGFPTSDSRFWSTREPSRLMDSLECAYFRYQANTDHVQGAYKGHAEELVNLAVRGMSPWVQLNDNPPNEPVDPARSGEFHWPGYFGNHRGTILTYLLDFSKEIKKVRGVFPQ